MSAHAAMSGGPLDRKLPVTFFTSFAASEKREESYSLRALANRIRAVTAVKKSSLPWLKLARFGDIRTDANSLRHDSNLLAISGIEADYDGGVMTVDEAVERLDKAGIAAMVYTSPSHTEDAPRWRIVCPTSEELPGDKRQHLVGRLNGLFSGLLAGESFTLSQSYYYGSVNHNPSHRVELIDGTPIDEHDELDEIWQGRPHTASKPGQTFAGPVDKSALLSEIMTGAGYHTATVRIAGILARQQMPVMEARQVLVDAMHGVPEAQRDARWHDRFADINRTLIDIYGKEAAKLDAYRHPEPPPEPDGYWEGVSEAGDGPEPEAEILPPPGIGHNSLPMQWFEDIEPMLDAADFVQGVLVAQSAAVVYGESNAGKTFWVTDLALHVAAGMPWNGRRVEGGGVVYVVLEGGIGFRNRVSAWKTEHGMQNAKLPFVAIPASVNLLNPEADTPRLIAAIQSAMERIGGPVKLVVIDTLARALAGGNENAPEDMGALVMNMDAVRAATGTMVLFVHHSGKDAAKGARGHSSLRAAVDTEIEVVADDEAQTKAATVVKQRDLKKGDVFGFALDIKVLGKNRHGEDVTTCVVKHEAAEPKHAPGTKQLPRVKGHTKRALEVLSDLINASGQAGHAGAPAGVKSVPEQWWRDRFYDAAMPGAEQDTKKRTFRRAADDLTEKHLVAVDKGRVWLSRPPVDEPDHDPETGEIL